MMKTRNPDRSAHIPITDFTHDPRVHVAVNKIKRMADKHFSDIVDDAGHQYVDLVMEGGGILGIALVGYCYGLEQAGIRFLGLGGTSAGAITAMLLAAAGTPDQAKGDQMIEMLANMPMADFLDGNPTANDVALTAAHHLPDWDWLWQMPMLWKVPRLLYTLYKNNGINPGTQFEHWLTQTIARYAISSSADLRAKLTLLHAHVRDDIPEDEVHPTSTTTPIEASLKIIASDITTGSKVEFPHHASLYWEHVDSVNPAAYVRASMSIPLFFYPYVVSPCPQVADPSSPTSPWKTLLSYDGKPPSSATFIDGGIVENFPIGMFHAPYRIPRAPTFGVKLSGRRKLSSANNIYHLLSGIFNVARHALDYDYIINHPDYHYIVKYIKINHDDYNWLDLSMPSNKKVELFRLGVEAAASFLKTFDWAHYKQVRQGMAEAANA